MLTIVNCLRENRIPTVEVKQVPQTTKDFFFSSVKSRNEPWI